jgi:hypothetical protein
VQFYNSVISAYKTNKGDPEALDFAGQMHTMAQTWARILEGGVQSAAKTNVSSAQDAERLLSDAMSHGQLESFIHNVIFKDRDHRMQGVEDDKARLLDELRHPERTFRPKQPRREPTRTQTGGGTAGGGGAAGGGTRRNRDGLLAADRTGQAPTEPVMRQYIAKYGLKNAGAEMRKAGYR